MRDFTAVLRIAMLGLACMSMASCATPPPPPPPPPPPAPPPPPPPPPPTTLATVTCPKHSSYPGPQLPTKEYDVSVTSWLTPSGIQVKPEPANVSDTHPGLCIESSGDLHIYKSDVLQVVIHFHLDRGLGNWYPTASYAFQADMNAMMQPPDLTNGVLNVYLKAKGGGGPKYFYSATYVDYSNQEHQTEPGIQNH